MKIGNREFDVNNDTYVMGILNVTPDSFFGWRKIQQSGSSTCPYRGNDKGRCHDY